MNDDYDDDPDLSTNSHVGVNSIADLPKDLANELVKKLDETLAQPTKPSSGFGSDWLTAAPSKKKKKNKRGVGKGSSGEIPTSPIPTPTPTSTSPKPKSNLFKGKTFTITTISNGLQHENPEDSYLSQKAKLISLGANVIETVSKSLDFLLARKSAVEGMTQKVRKAIKRNCRVIDLDGWVNACIEAKKILIPVPAEFDFTELARECIEKRGANTNTSTNTSTSELVSISQYFDNIDPNDENWSAPAELGCCCICHENHPANTITPCEWCEGCNINQSLRPAEKEETN